MISPAFTFWPPKRFTPSRCALESRPLRLDDAPFLCAIVSALLRRGLLGRCLGGAAGDRGDLDLRVPLPVAQSALVAGLVPEVNDVDLWPRDGAKDLRRHL